MDENWPAVANNFSQARKVWRILLLLLSMEGAAPRVSNFFFKTVVQAVLLFGLDNWVVTSLMGKVLGGVSYPGGETAEGTAHAEDTGR